MVTDISMGRKGESLICWMVLRDISTAFHPRSREGFFTWVVSGFHQNDVHPPISWLVNGAAYLFKKDLWKLHRWRALVHIGDGGTSCCPGAIFVGGHFDASWDFGIRKAIEGSKHEDGLKHVETIVRYSCVAIFSITNTSSK